MSRIPSASPEVGVIRTYVDWLVCLPWNVSTDDRLDIKEAAQILDEDHYGLEKVKERILEYLAVRTLADTIRSPILAFVGPPGVGKTSLGKSHRQGDGPQVRAHEPRRHPRRGGDPRPPAHLHRRAAGPDHPEHQDRAARTTPCSCSTRSTRSAWTSGATRRRPCSRCSTRSRTTASRTTTWRCRSTCRKVLFIATGNLARPDPGRAPRPDGDHPAAGLHPAGEGRDRQAVPRPQADGEPRPDGEAHRDHRRGHDRARPGLHPGGRRPEPRARDRQRHAQGRPLGGRGPQAQDRRRPQEARASTSARRASSTASWRPRTRPARPRASS